MDAFGLVTVSVASDTVCEKGCTYSNLGVGMVESMGVRRLLISLIEFTIFGCPLMEWFVLRLSKLVIVGLLPW